MGNAASKKRLRSTTVHEEDKEAKCTTCRQTFNLTDRRQVCLPCHNEVRHCAVCLKCIPSLIRNNEIACPICDKQFDAALVMYTLNQNCLWIRPNGDPENGVDIEEEREHPGKRLCLERLRTGGRKNTPLRKDELEIALPKTEDSLVTLQRNSKHKINPSEFMKVYIPDPMVYNEKWRDAGYTYHIGDPIPYNIADIVIGPLFRCEIPAQKRVNTDDLSYNNHTSYYRSMRYITRCKSSTAFALAAVTTTTVSCRTSAETHHMKHGCC